jgi:hypothetical protein
MSVTNPNISTSRTFIAASPIVALGGSQYPSCPSGKTMILTFQLLDQNSNPIPSSELNTLILTLADTNSLTNGDLVIVNAVDQINILNTNRGTVDNEGNVTITLGSVPDAADTALLYATDTIELRSVIIDWTYNSGAQSGGIRLDFLITALGVGDSV